MTCSSRIGSLLTETEAGQLPGIDVSTVRQWSNQRIPRPYGVTPWGDQVFSLREAVDLLAKLKGNADNNSNTEDG